MTDLTNRARAAYNAYGHSVSYKTELGQPRPEWHQLDEPSRAAWLAATEALLPPLATALTTWQAWWEDYAGWDGSAHYLDLDTAKVHAAGDYVSEVYGDQDDPEAARPGELTWAEEHGSWHLSDGGTATLVQVSPTPVYRRR
jgi:hypothetical protein